MLVGTSSVTSGDVARHSHSPEEFIEYSDSLVPEKYRDNESIKMNQRYLCCMLLRKSDMSWDKKESIIDAVLKNTYITGYADVILAVDQFEDFADKKRVNQFVALSESSLIKRNNRVSGIPNFQKRRGGGHH